MVSVLALVAALTVGACPEAVKPVPGPEVAGFAPIGRYAGHWGVDYQAAPGSSVGAVADGTVSFAGQVAGRTSVSIDHGRGWVSTVSYLSAEDVARGERVRRGEVVATSGRAHGASSVHLSVRVAGEYVDPQWLFSCRLGNIPDALSLVPVPADSEG